MALALLAVGRLAAQSAGPEGDRLPRLATGSLELQWIDEHLPENGDVGGRRRALEEAIALFPEDPATVFRANARIAIADWDLGNPAAAHQRLEGILGDPGPLDRDLVAWAEILDARILVALHRPAEATELLRAVASDHRLSGARRSYAVAAAADAQLPGSPAGALALLREAASHQHPVEPVLEAGIVHALLVAGETEEAGGEVAGLAEARGEAPLVEVLQAAAAWSLRDDPARMLQLVDLVSAARPNPGPALAAALTETKAAAALQVVQARLARLKTLKPLSAWFAVGPADRRLGVAALDQAVAAAAAKRDPRRCLQLELRAAILEGTGPGLPRRLWEAAGFADWVERSPGGAAVAGICDPLLDLCDQLPAGSDFWMEGKFLRADRRARLGDRPGEQELLNQVLSAGPRPAYLAAVCRLLGRSLEETGDYQKALAVYASGEAEMARFPAGIDALLHAVMLHLQFGDDDEALRLIGILRSAPAKVIQDSTAPAQVREFIALAESGRAAECWKAGRGWWAGWRPTAATLVGPSRLTAVDVPVFPSAAAVGAEARRAADAGDGAAYFQRFNALLSAARWLPSAAPEAAAVAAPALRLAPASEHEIRAMLIQMLESPHPAGIAGLRKRQMFLAANYLNARQPDEALRVAGLFNAAADRGDPLAPAVHQIRGLAALDAGRDYAPALADLESDLASRADVERSMTVGVVADLYHRLGRDEDARRLLRHELQNPAMANDPGRMGLARRLARLSPAAGPAPAEAPPVQPSDAWIRAVGLDWFDFTEPKSLAAAGLPSLDQALRDPARFFPAAGQTKFLLLAAREPSLTAAQRQQALGEACVRIVLAAQTIGQLDGIGHAVVDAPSFADEVRLRVLWTVLAQLAENGHRADYEAWRKSPLCARFSDDFQRQLALLDRQAALDRGAPDKVLAWAESLGAHDLDFAGLQTMGDLFGLLLQDGRVDLAREMATEAEGWKVGPGLTDALASLRLDLARRLRLAASLEPVHAAMKGALLREYPAFPAALPAQFRDQLVPGRLPARLPGPTFQACLYLAATDQFERGDFGFWDSVFGSLPSDARGAAAAAAVLGAGLKGAADDALRSELIVRFFSSADTDDPALRAGAEREFAPYRRPGEYPQSYLAIRLYEIHRDLRLGKPFVPEIAYQDLNDPRVPSVRARDALRYYRRVGDLPGLRRTVDSIDSAALVGPSMVGDAIPALAALGMTEELAAARAAARRILRRDISESWGTGDAAAAGSALDLALVLQEPQALPEGWVRDLGNDPSRSLLSGRVRLVAAFLSGDWPGVLAAATDLNRDYPNRYSFYWYRGLALHRLGREAEAARALTVYVAHAKDEAEFSEATKLLGQIGSAETRPLAAR